MPNLLFSKGPLPLFQVRLTNSRTKIGRSPRCDVILPEPEISREHATIHRVEEGYFLKVHGSQAVHLNGRKTEQGTLQEGDQIRLGPWHICFAKDPPGSQHPETTQNTLFPEGQTQAVAQNSRGLWVQKLKLHIQQGGREAMTFPLEGKPVSIGAGEGNDLVLKDPYISARHLKVVPQSDGVWVYDLGSTNGTFLGGIKIREAQWDPELPLKIGECQINLIGDEEIEKVLPVQLDSFLGMVGGSALMQNLYGTLQRIGPTDATVLVLGESGAGKELVARALHQLSPRSRGPFVALNCGAIPHNLIESELFGHEKGAYTGAQSRHDGAFGQAQGGTLFLDEIGELPLDLQPKLLRVLENRSFRRLGGSEELDADVRVIAATHRDLSERVKQKTFRKDLFFRLFVFPIAVPALREHKTDIPLLAKNFLKEFSPGPVVPRLGEAAMKKLMAHDFPGNIRELRNCLLRSLLFAGGKEIPAKAISFPEEFSLPGRGEDAFSGVQKLEEVERKMILRALETHQWNKSKAAEVLGVAKSTLFTKIKIYHLQGPPEK